MAKQRKILLNLGAGTIDYERFQQMEYTHILHVDKSYDRYGLDQFKEDIQSNQALYQDGFLNHYMIGADLFEFLDGFKMKIDDVMAERIFEHIEYVNGSIGRLLEALNTITKPTSMLTIVVPNHVLIAKKILYYEKNHSDFNHTQSLNTKLIINTENHNISQDPHLSTWTPTLAREYINSEGTWFVSKIIPQITFAGRDIYMKIICVKP